MDSSTDGMFQMQMEKKLCLRRYAKKPLGYYPEVDKHIDHDPKATKAEFRYLVNGEVFASSLTMAREKVAELLGVNATQAVAAKEVYYTPATGFTMPTKPKTDEGSSTMSAVAEQAAVTTANATQQPASQMTGVQVPTGSWLKAIQNLENYERENPEPSKDDKEAHKKWSIKRGHLRRGVAHARNFQLYGATPGQKKGAKATAAKAAGKPKDPVTDPIQGRTDYQQPVAAAPALKADPMMIRVGGVEITVNTLDQMDGAIASLKRNNVI